MIDDDTMIARATGMITADVGEGTVILDTATADFIEINRSAGIIWGLIETPLSFAALCDALHARFEVEPAQCRAEVIAFAQIMNEKGLVSLAR